MKRLIGIFIVLILFIGSVLGQRDTSSIYANHEQIHINYITLSEIEDSFLDSCAFTLLDDDSVYFEYKGGFRDSLEYYSVSGIPWLYSSQYYSSKLYEFNGEIPFENSLSGMKILKVTFFNDREIFKVSEFKVEFPVINSLDDLVERDLLFYPNPTQGDLYFSEEVVVKVVGKRGELLYEGNTDIIDFQSMPSGEYLIQINYKDSLITKKVIKN